MCAWRRYAEEWFRKDNYLFEGHYSDAKKRVEEGDETSSVAATLITEQSSDLSEKESAWLCATLFAAGSDTVEF
jgi:hypothetical protein